MDSLQSGTSLAGNTAAPNEMLRPPKLKLSHSLRVSDLRFAGHLPQAQETLPKRHVCAGFHTGWALYPATAFYSTPAGSVGDPRRTVNFQNVQRDGQCERNRRRW